MKKFVFKIPFTSYLALFIGILFTVILYIHISKNSEEKERLRFEIAVKQVTLSTQNRLTAYEQTLRAGEGLWASSDDVNREEWHTFVKTLKIEKNFPGIQGLGYSKVVWPNELKSHQEKMRKEGFVNYAIKPYGVRDMYTSIIYLEPFNSRNQRAFSYDMFSEKTRREAMLRSINTGDMSISGVVRLLQENGIDEQAGFLMYIPVYKKGYTLTTDSDRLDAIAGLVYAPFRSKDLLAGILGSLADSVHLKVFDKASNKEFLLFDSHPNMSFSSGLAINRVIDIGGRSWVLKFEDIKATPAYEAWVVLIVGFVASFALFGFVFTITRTNQRAKEIAEEMTQELELKSKRLQLALDGSGDGVWDWNISSNDVLFDKQWKKMLGFNENEIENSLDEWKNRVHPDDLEKVFADINSHLDGLTKYYANEHRVLCKDGTYKWVLDRGIVTHRDSEGRPTRMVGTHSDISARKEAELLLVEFNEQLTKRVEEEISKRANLEAQRQRDLDALTQSAKMAELGSMLGAIIHQWKQPLNIISLEAQTLAFSNEYGSLSTESLNETVASITKQVQFMSKTADDFRDFYKPSKEKVLFSPLESVEEVTSLLTKQLQNDKIELEIYGLGDGLVLGAKGELKQVILNIINNAKDIFQESKPDKAKITIYTKVDENSIYITISDNAGGIPEELLPDKLFESFVSTKGEKGTGIGLSLSKTIVEESMLGRLTAENITGGASFIIVLPLAKNTQNDSENL